MNFNLLKKILFSFLSISILVIASVHPLNAEFIFLKTGEIIEGTIVSDAAKSITIRTKDKSIKSIARDDIMRVLYTKLNMGKIFVQKRDGKGMEVYLVDEDQESYTFRYDINKPEEFTIKRSAISFITEKNPSGLEGEAGTDRVSLKWLPPYNRVKFYTLYIKTSENEKYEISETTSGLSLTLKNLKSNTTYWLTVTATDHDNYESLRSNELKITTGNIKPEKPYVISAEKAVSADKKTMLLKIRLKDGIDPDGKVEKFRIYTFKNNNRTLTAEISSKEYILADASSFDQIEVTAVDNMGDESAAERVRVKGSWKDLLTVEDTGPKIYYWEFLPGVIVPLGVLGDVASIGYGADITVNKRSMYFRDFNLGLGLGFYYLDGKNMLEENDNVYEYLLMVPVYLTMSYNVWDWESFYLYPYLSAGGIYNDLTYIDAAGDDGQNKVLRIFEPVVRAGITAGYKISGRVSAISRCEYSAIIELSGILHSLNVNAGIAYSF